MAELIRMRYRAQDDDGTPTMWATFHVSKDKALNDAADLIKKGRYEIEIEDGRRPIRMASKNWINPETPVFGGIFGHEQGSLFE